MYKYGMRLREFGIGCQPKQFKKFEYCNKNKTGYWSYVWYDRELTESELSNFDMDFLEREN